VSADLIYTPHNFYSTLMPQRRHIRQLLITYSVNTEQILLAWC